MSAITSLPAAPEPPTAQHATVYASFLMGDEEFAIDVKHVQEVVNLPDKLVPMPLAPDFVPGVFNLRGAIIPVLSGRRLLGQEGGPAWGDGSKVVIVQHGGVRLGLVFDQTHRVLRPRGEEQTLFSYEDSSVHQVVAGVLRMGDDLIRVLDLPRLVRIENVPHDGVGAASDMAARAKRKRTRCISFRVGNMLLGFAIQGVHEIVFAKGIEPSPVQEPLCAGVMNIRDNIVPVVRFRDLLRLPSAQADGCSEAEQRVIVLQLGNGHVGLLVDSVEAITPYAEEDVMHVPVLTRNRIHMFAGCLDLGEHGHMFLLDGQRVMDHEEIGRISGQHSALFAARRGKTQRQAQQVTQRETYLWFDAKVSFALRMSDVREIIDCGDAIIPMPGAPHFVAGMHDLRGDLVTLVDVRRFYRLGEPDAGDVLERKVVVLRHHEALLGLLVDRVCSIVHVEAKSKYPVPLLMRNAMAPAVRHDVTDVVVTGAAPDKLTHLLLLDVSRIFESITEEELDTVDA